jgi:N6-L-threonylcarbamoyladenine synthase
MLILGIETSCDETSAALVKDGKEILSNIVYSQVDIHSRFNGVVPEIASRNHLLKMIPILEEAVGQVSPGDIDGVAVTNGPGLIGSLLIGLSAAKAMAYVLKKPFIPVNHIEAHMYAPHLFHSIDFPYIGLVVSGGHTLLYRVHSFDNMELLGSTIDDAIGEAFDKLSKIMGLGYRPNGAGGQSRQYSGIAEYSFDFAG